MPDTNDFWTKVARVRERMDEVIRVHTEESLKVAEDRGALAGYVHYRLGMPSLCDCLSPEFDLPPDSPYRQDVEAYERESTYYIDTDLS